MNCAVQLPNASLERHLKQSVLGGFVDSVSLIGGVIDVIDVTPLNLAGHVTHTRTAPRPAVRTQFSQ